MEIWDRGTYELVEEKKDGGLTVRLHGARLEGLWTLVPAALDGDPRNWLLLRKDGGGAAGELLRRCWRLRPTRCRAAPVGPSSRSGTASGRSPASSAATRRCGAGTTTTSPAAFRPSRRRSASPSRTPSAVLDGEVCALDEEGRSGFGLLQQGSGTLVFVVFDVLERDGEPLLDRTYPSAVPLLDRAARACGRRRPAVALVRRRRRARTGGARAWARGRRGEAGRLDLPARPPLARLAQVEVEATPGARRRRIHPRQGPAEQRDRLARARGPRRRRASLCRQRRHRAHGRGARPPRAPAATDPASGLTVRRRAEAAACPARRRDLGRAHSRGRGRIRRVDSRWSAARACVPRAARRQGGRRGRGASSCPSRRRSGEAHGC